MYVVGVDFGNMRVRNNDKRKVPKGLDAVGEASGEDGQSEVGRGEKLRRGEGRASMSA